MKKTRSITTTVNVTPSDVKFVPKLGEVPNESEAERVRRKGRIKYRRYYQSHRAEEIQRAIRNVNRKRQLKKMMKTA